MNGGLFIPQNYRSLLDVRQTEKAIYLIKEYFQTNLAFELDLVRVTAPLFVLAGTGVNDDLNGTEKPVSFAVRQMDAARAEIVQSLAKWKRMALAELAIPQGQGLYTDMNAIRPDETLDHTHSLYVDQWDWERVMSKEERTIAFLQKIVRRIYDVIRRTEKYICHEFGVIKPLLPEAITFYHAEELEEKYPGLSPKQRENAVCKEHGAVFVIGIGAALKNGKAHDGRAPDYDDWSTTNEKGFKGLNGDILVYNPVFESAFELSSMGIRVDKDALLRQLALTGTENRKGLLFHSSLLNGKLPLSIGGGIGQSRLCMLYLRKAHIGEIQASIWPADMVATCRENNINLL